MSVSIHKYTNNLFVFSGLDLLNISLDTLTPEKFEFISRRKGFFNVLKSIRKALNLNFNNPIKINCVVMKGVNDDELCDFVALTKEMPLNVRFIEYMPFDGNRWSSKKMISFQEMLEVIQTKYKNIKPIYDSSDLNPTAKFYKVKNFVGKVGFIASITQNFCSSCNRLRITADGNLKVSLTRNFK